VGIIIASTLLNAAYFMPIVYAAFFKPEQRLGQHSIEHGEAPSPIVIAVVATATLTILLFLFPEVPLTLAEQMMGIVQ
jgi:multicomponent Na+:H+ antiporter subunit D